MEGKMYDVVDVLNAGCMLEPIVCRYCGSIEVVFLQYVDDGYCEECGRWQDDVMEV